MQKVVRGLSGVKVLSSDLIWSRSVAIWCNLRKIGHGVMCARDSWTRELWLEKTYINRYFYLFDVATGFEMSSNVRH